MRIRGESSRLWAQHPPNLTLTSSSTGGCLATTSLGGNIYKPRIQNDGAESAWRGRRNPANPEPQSSPELGKSLLLKKLELKPRKLYKGKREGEKNPKTPKHIKKILVLVL